MTNLLKFPLERPRRDRSTAVGSSAEVIIFPGDRIERRGLTRKSGVAKAKRGRSRQQAVKLKED